MKKEAFKLLAKIPNESWSLKGTTLLAENEEAAIERFKTINSELKPNHVYEVEAITVHSSDTKLQSDNYPYGYLKCTAFFSVECTKNGFREIFQTINPKNGKLNAPKKSTYARVILPATLSNGHFSSVGHLSFDSGTSINVGLHFMHDFYSLFTTEQIKRIALDVIVGLRAHIQVICTMGNVQFETLKPLVEAQVKAAAQIAKTGEDLFLDCLLDNAKINELKDPNFEPFKRSEPISILSMMGGNRPSATV